MGDGQCADRAPPAGGLLHSTSAPPPAAPGPVLRPGTCCWPAGAPSKPPLLRPLLKPPLLPPPPPPPSRPPPPPPPRLRWLARQSGAWPTRCGSAAASWWVPGACADGSPPCAGSDAPVRLGGQVHTNKGAVSNSRAPQTSPPPFHAGGDLPGTHGPPPLWLLARRLPPEAQVSVALRCAVLCCASLPWCAVHSVLALARGHVEKQRRHALPPLRARVCRYGEAFDAVKARTSTLPFAAILDGRQQLPQDYYKARAFWGGGGRGGRGRGNRRGGGPRPSAALFAAELCLCTACASHTPLCPPPPPPPPPLLLLFNRSSCVAHTLRWSHCVWAPTCATH